MIHALAVVVVLLTCGYFLALGSAALVSPERARRFLLGFAATPLAHYAEMLARLAIGASLAAHAPHMFATRIVSLFGWLIVASTVVLLLLPWRWHHRFATRVVPPATRYIGTIGICCLVLGVLLLAAFIRGAK